MPHDCDSDSAQDNRAIKGQRSRRFSCCWSYDLEMKWFASWAMMITTHEDTAEGMVLGTVMPMQSAPESVLSCPRKAEIRYKGTFVSAEVREGGPSE